MAIAIPLGAPYSLGSKQRGIVSVGPGGNPNQGTAPEIVDTYTLPADPVSLPVTPVSTAPPAAAPGPGLQITGTQLLIGAVLAYFIFKG
jgi:hypothetical protein